MRWLGIILAVIALVVLLTATGVINTGGDGTDRPKNRQNIGGLGVEC